MPVAADLAGRRFGALVVVRREGSNNFGKAAWHCQCDCGGTSVAATGSLRSGHTTSCGSDVHLARGGMSKAFGSSSWYRMISRCHNPSDPSFARYGGRGIVVCERWRGENGLAAFLDDIGPRPSTRYTIDRVNNDGPYSPDNCRWATGREQCSNTRRNRLITFAGTFIDTVAGWSRVTGLKYDTIRDRTRRGWTPDETLLTPEGGRRGEIAEN